MRLKRQATALLTLFFLLAACTATRPPPKPTAAVEKIGATKAPAQRGYRLIVQAMPCGRPVGLPVEVLDPPVPYPEGYMEWRFFNFVLRSTDAAVVFLEPPESTKSIPAQTEKGKPIDRFYPLQCRDDNKPVEKGEIILAAGAFRFQSWTVVEWDDPDTGLPQRWEGSWFFIGMKPPDP